MLYKWQQSPVHLSKAKKELLKMLCSNTRITYLTSLDDGKRTGELGIELNAFRARAPSASKTVIQKALSIILTEVEVYYVMDRF